MDSLSNMDRRITVPRGFLSSFLGEDRPITVDEACALRLLLFGNTTDTFKGGWKKQGFQFRPKPSYGIVQKHSGPCGLLAAVQAYVIYELLFGPCRILLDAQELNPDIGEKNESLARALTTMLWQAGDYREAILAIKYDNKTLDNSVTSNILTEDGTLEYLKLKYFRSRDGLLGHLYNYIQNLKKEGGSILFLYSLMLTHGIDKMKTEMDSPDIRLIGNDEYCSQELVNLALTGKATSNVFDGQMELDSGGEEHSIHRGISQQSKIGLLSLYEYYNMSPVGNYYKNPEYPIWVIYGEMHYTILFGTSRNIFKHPEKAFKLFYYNGLSRRNEDECLVINPNERLEEAEKNKSLPVVIKCIYTRWPLASIEEEFE